jgi:hypothetical protein
MGALSYFIIGGLIGCWLGEPFMDDPVFDQLSVFDCSAGLISVGGSGSRLAWWRYGIDGGAAVAGGVDRAYAEDDVVLGDRQRDRRVGAGGDHAGPVRLVGIAIDDLEGGSGGEACRLLPA